MLPQLNEKSQRSACMRELEQVEWEEGQAFNCFGASIGVRVNEAGLMDRVEALLPPNAKPAPSPMVDNLWSFYAAPSSGVGEGRGYHLLYDDSSRVVRTLDLDELFEQFASRIHFNVAVRATPYLFVHAGVVECGGQTLVMPGRSMTGKSSLVAELVQAGATYFSDEYAVFDEAGRVHPYPRALSLRAGEGGKRMRVTAEQLGGTSGTRPLPVGVVAVAPYEPGTSWYPQALTAGEAVLALLDNTVLARSRSQNALRVLRKAVDEAAALESTRGEAGETALRLLNTLQGTTMHGASAPIP